MKRTKQNLIKIVGNILKDTPIGTSLQGTDKKIVSSIFSLYYENSKRELWDIYFAKNKKITNISVQRIPNSIYKKFHIEFHNYYFIPDASYRKAIKSLSKEQLNDLELWKLL